MNIPDSDFIMYLLLAIGVSFCMGNIFQITIQEKLRKYEPKESDI